MPLESKCPKCATIFELASHRVLPAEAPPTTSPDANEQRRAAAGRVKCPKCGHEFTSLAFTVFVGPRALVLGLVLIAIAVVVAMFLFDGFQA